MMDVVFWLAQHLLAVLLAGTVRVPEIFLLSLVYRLLTNDRDVNVSVIWAAFAGGLLWDLRWIGIPFFTLCYVLAVLGVMSFWNTLPSSGRTMPIIFFLFWAAQLLPAVLFVLVLERGTGNTDWMLFGLQQGCAVPISFLSAFLYFRHEKSRNV